MWTQISGTMPASSQASSELSTASLTAVSNALRGLSNPSRWRFFAKNSLTEMSRCLAAIVSAVTRFRGCSLSSIIQATHFVVYPGQIRSWQEHRRDVQKYYNRLAAVALSPRHDPQTHMGQLNGRPIHR